MNLKEELIKIADEAHEYRCNKNYNDLIAFLKNMAKFGERKVVIRKDDLYVEKGTLERL